MLQRRTYCKENNEDYLIISERRTTSGVHYVPHDFLPFQANLTFHAENKPNEEQHRCCCVYLIRQGQQVVVEEDGCGRHPIILVVMRKSPTPSDEDDENRCSPSSMCWEFGSSKVRESPLVNQIKEKRLTYRGRCR